MTTAPTYPKLTDARYARHRSRVNDDTPPVSGYRKRYLDIRPGRVLYAVAFMMTLSTIGLGLFPMWLVAFTMLAIALIQEREEFLVMATIMITSVCFVPDRVVPFSRPNLLLVITVLALFFYRTRGTTRKVLWMLIGYAVFLFLMAQLSEEKFSIQFKTMGSYITMLTFIIPMWVFANRGFDIHKFWEKVLLYSLVICVFYMLDAFVIQGALFVPVSRLTGQESMIGDMRIFTGVIPRKYPQGIYILAMAAYPLARYYRLRWWQWLIVIGGVGVTRTMTVVASLILTIVIFQGNFKRFAKMMLIALAFLVVMYAVDNATGGNLRIASTVRQFVDLGEVQDEEDLAQFGSQRMAQIIPKYEALVNQNSLLQGFGFIHPELTTLPRYQIYNDLYENPDFAEEAVASVEVTQFNTIIHTGIIGLLVQAGFYLGIYFIIRRLRDAQYYLSLLLVCSIQGLGGFMGLNDYKGLLWAGLSLAVVLLANRTAPWQTRVNEDIGYDTSATNLVTTTTPQQK